MKTFKIKERKIDQDTRTIKSKQTKAKQQNMNN